MDTIRFGVIGLNRGESFVKICRAVGYSTVTALYDIDLSRTEQLAATINARAFDDFQAFLNADIDAVVVASPMPYHAAQSIAALNAGKHVLSEVTSCRTVAEAQALVRAASQASPGHSMVYMLAENYRYLDEVELLKRLHDDRRFGELYFGEGEYLHDCKGLWHHADDSLTWRGQGLLSVYCTHSLGPLLYITGERVTQVSALAVPGGKFEPEVTFPTMHLLQMVTEGGLTLRVRVDHVSPRPHQMAYYALQGTAGSYEAWRGLGDASKIWLADEDEPSLSRAPARWQALADLAPRYIPERLQAPPAARSGGHGTSEYWLLRDFLRAVRGEAPSPIDLYRGLDYTLPVLYAVDSAAAGGVPITVPDPRSW